MIDRGNNLAVKELFHSLIHDLRRPVEMGLGYSDLSLREIPVSEKNQREYFKIIAQQFKDVTVHPPRSMLRVE
ncbi:hypothetical protein MNBD_CHLOROFLEXI01-4474 [hydrothermal vent metagenome]|uniref:Uncharacterized protein n=1 Tax=hydrothermal vent metagenome TaxID=652676 RepID=A0A3B0UYP7_9ZZZZ